MKVKIWHRLPVPDGTTMPNSCSYSILVLKLEIWHDLLMPYDTIVPNVQTRSLYNPHLPICVIS